MALSRFAHYFGTLHDAGLEVAPSLSLMERVLGNPYLAQRFRSAVQRVLAGESLSRALATVGEFSPIVIQMVALGETTGQMSKALQQVRQYYDREVDATVNRALTLFGPIALIALASVFVLIAVAFYLPLFNLARAIQMKTQRRVADAGFTLIEIVIIIAVLTILATAITPAILQQVIDAKIEATRQGSEGPARGHRRPRATSRVRSGSSATWAGCR